jgi:hypothetical protein
MLPDRRTLRQGLVVGLIAYVTVALFYSAFDFLAARGAFFTVDMLGKAAFRGLRDPAVLMLPGQLDPSGMFLYNGLHLILSLVIGVIVTAIVDQADRHPAVAPLLLVAIVAGGVVTVLVVGYLTQAARPVLPWSSIVTANVLASAVAGVYLLWRRPGLRRRFTSMRVASS